MKFCPHCGSKLVVEGSRFCQHCGTELRGGPSLPEGLQPTAEPANRPAAGESDLAGATTAGIGGAVAASLPNVGAAAPGRLSPWFWVGGVLVLLLLISWLLPAFAAVPPSRTTAFLGLDIILILGLMNAYLFRRVGRRRMLGFALGAVVGLTLLWSIKIALGGAQRVGLLPVSDRTAVDTAPSGPGAGSASPSTFIDSTGWTEESTGTAESGPWLDYSPAGTRFYRDAKGIIYRLYPPGVKPNAEPANPFGLNDSSLEPPGRPR